MNQDYRANVEEYLVFCDTDNLRFGHYLTEEIQDFSKLFGEDNLRDLIILCIRLAAKYCSVNSLGSYETSSDSHRSCIDIWRHIKNYRPEFSIFDVMSEMYKMGMEGILVGHICGTIGRRVFELSESYSNWDLVAQDDLDEFDLTFDCWNNI